MRDSGAKLDKKQEEAIVALLTQRNVEEAARAIDMATSTLYRWMQEPAFDAAFREARRLAFRQSIARLQQGATAAATTLLKIMLDPRSAFVPVARCRQRARARREGDRTRGHRGPAGGPRARRCHERESNMNLRALQRRFGRLRRCRWRRRSPDGTDRSRAATGLSLYCRSHSTHPPTSRGARASPSARHQHGGSHQRRGTMKTLDRRLDNSKTRIGCARPRTTDRESKRS